MGSEKIREACFPFTVSDLAKNRRLNEQVDWALDVTVTLGADTGEIEALRDTFSRPSLPQRTGSSTKPRESILVSIGAVKEMLQKDES